MLDATAINIFLLARTEKRLTDERLRELELNGLPPAQGSDVVKVAANRLIAIHAGLIGCNVSETAASGNGTTSPVRSQSVTSNLN